MRSTALSSSVPSGLDEPCILSVAVVKAGYTLEIALVSACNTRAEGW